MSRKPRTTTLTVRITEDTSAKLDRLAGLTERSRSFLVARILEDGLDHDIEDAEKTLDAIRSIKAGHGVSQEDIKRETDRLIQAAHTRRSRKSA